MLKKTQELYKIHVDTRCSQNLIMVKKIIVQVFYFLIFLYILCLIHPEQYVDLQMFEPSSLSLTAWDIFESVYWCICSRTS